MSGWWDSITSSAQLLVDEISAQANEATNDIVKEQLQLKREEEARRAKTLESLPWESADESKAILSEALMADILQLALCDKNFTESPPIQIVDCCHFDLQLYISQAMRLLSLDQNLAHIHAKISPKMDEEIFWKNYFVRIYYLRCKSGLLDCQDPIVQAVSSFSPEDVIFKASTGSASSAIISPAREKGKVSEGSVNPATSITAPVKAKTWENSSSEDVSEMSTSSYEVVPTTSGQVASPITNLSSGSKHDGSEGDDDNDDALFEAQLKAELEDSTTKPNDEEDDDFDDLADFDDLDDLDVDDDDDAELEAQIARELANEE